MAKREPLAFRPVTELPDKASLGTDGRAGPFTALAEEAKANSGTWYELDCSSARQAANRAGQLRKQYDLVAHSRGEKVYFGHEVEAGS